MLQYSSVLVNNANSFCDIAALFPSNAYGKEKRPSLSHIHSYHTYEPIENIKLKFNDPCTLNYAGKYNENIVLYRESIIQEAIFFLLLFRTRDIV